MNERGWFTLLVRGTGLWFAMSGIGGVATLLTNMGLSWFNAPRNQPVAPLVIGSTPSFALMQGVGELTIVLAGLYLLFRGGKLIDWLCKSVVGRCRACGYRLGGGESTCPECGVPAQSGR